jgi:hypothetical protein
MGTRHEDDEAFMRKFTLPIEDRLAHPTWPQWNGGHRWFRSGNVIDLMNRRSQAEKERIYVNLLHHPARIYRPVKSA